MRLVIACLLGLSGLIVAGCDRQKAESPQGEAAAPPPDATAGAIDRTHAGTPAPDTPFEDPDGQPASLADFRGKPVLLNLWATWCAPCIVEMPSLDALAARRDDLHVVTLSQDMDGRDKVERFFAEQGYRTIETWLDPRLDFMVGLGLGTLPTTILYDAEGREVWRKVGIADWNGEEAAALIAEAG